MNVLQASSQTGKSNEPYIKEEGLREGGKAGVISMVKKDNRAQYFDEAKVHATLKRVSEGLEQDISIEAITKEFKASLFDGMTTGDVEKGLILAATAFIERSAAYSILAARLTLQKIYKAVFGYSVNERTLEGAYKKAFIDGIQFGVAQKRLDEKLLSFDLDLLSSHLAIEHDKNFKFMGIDTLEQRYLLKVDDKTVETPQALWMRVAMGLAINEKDHNLKALEFYNIFSTTRAISSTPTLFHSGTLRAQLSSCFISTVYDDLHHIFKSIGDNAQLLKWSGGIANDWSYIRATGTKIKSINVPSQGVIPFLKVANDTTAAINRSGRRRGAAVVYLETWHLEIEDFLDLRRNTGDERRRTHEINTANWIPDLFMKRVEHDKDWMLFSPHEVSDLHDLYGAAFEEAYVRYEQMAHDGKIKNFKIISAKKLWKKMLTRLFETGGPWITFKDAFNVRSPQDHAGVIHSTNLCTEIGLNTSDKETAVCNLASINLSAHIINGKVDKELLADTVTTTMRMLDNVIDINFYPTPEGEYSNKKHRPVGLGLMGLQDAYFKLNIPFSSPQALELADEVGEFISYHAISASSDLAAEHGAYESFKGSKWDRGIMPHDTLDLLEQERGVKVECSRTTRMDWASVRDKVAKQGMRNSNTMAIAPTATISNIAGCYPCIEPIYKNIYVKSNTSGEFIIINEYLVEDLKKLGMWNKEICELIKYYDGSIQQIEEIPAELKEKYKTAFEIDPEWLIQITAARGKWIDQSQSHNVFMQGVSGKKISDIYFAAWKAGLKSTYYFRTLGATQVEKSTLDAAKFGFTQKRVYKTSEVTDIENSTRQKSACDINDSDCESCQ